MGLFDFLGDLAPVLGPAARGYTAGLARGEEFKLKQNQLKSDAAYKQQQLDLQKRKQGFDEKQAGLEPIRKLQQLVAQTGAHVIQQDATNPELAANNAYQQRRGAILGWGQMGLQLASRPDVSEQELHEWMNQYPGVVQKVAAQSQQPQQQQPPAQDTPELPNIFHVAPKMTNVPGVGSVFGQVANTPMEMRPPQDTGTQTVTAPPAPRESLPFPPEYQAKIDKAEADTEYTKTRTDYTQAQIDELAAISGLKPEELKARIEQLRSQAAFNTANTAQLTGKQEIARREQDRKESATRSENQRRAAQTANEQAEHARKAAADAVTAELQRAQAGKAKADTARIKKAVDAVAETLDPADKALFQQYAGELIYQDAFKDPQINPEALKGMNQILSQYPGMGKGVKAVLGIKAPTAKSADLETRFKNATPKLKGFDSSEVEFVKKHIREGTIDQFIGNLKDKASKERAKKMFAILKGQ